MAAELFDELFPCQNTWLDRCGENGWGYEEELEDLKGERGESEKRE